MCGIAGIISTQGNLSTESIHRMSDVLVHRGPDGKNIWLDHGCFAALGHCRLSIIDLSERANQPMHDPSGRYSIVYNGEIYNYRELRSQLKDIEWKTDSDTEVLLQLLINYGKDALDMLDGMFAFALYDNKTKKLLCARDRFGEKPFYYLHNSNGFYFGSEIKSLIAELSSIKADKEKLKKFIEGDKLPESECYFNGIKQLLPAHWLELQDNKISIGTYWEISIPKTVKSGSLNDYIVEFRRLFELSVKRRLRSDVPVGSSLSGGLDSSSVVCMISQLEKLKFNTFSARFNSGKDEGKWIDEVTRKTGVENFQVFPDPSKMISDMDVLIRHHEYPVASSSIYAQWCVMRLAKQNNITVLLDGQGADEYLAGYDELKYYAVWERYYKGNFKSFIHELKMFKYIYGKSPGFSFLTDPLLFLFGLRRAVHKNGLTLKDQLRFYLTHNLGELLRYADRNSMAHSIEVRLPFLFHELVEFVFSIPSEFIYREGKTKYILREAMRDLLPEKIYERTDKIGFAPPQDDWLMRPDAQEKIKTANETLLSAGLKPGSDQFKNISAASFLEQFG